MKNNAIIRIILWSVIIVLIMAILCGALAYRSLRRETAAVATEPTVPLEIIAGNDPAGTSTDEIGTVLTELPAGEISSISIQWVAGDIMIRSEPGIQTIQICEVSSDPVSKYQTVIRHIGNRLTVRFCEEMRSLGSLSIGKSLHKDLTILVPENWQSSELELDVAATNLILQELSLREVDFDGASGTCEFRDCTIDDLDVDTASGDIRYSGNLNTLSFDAASASFYGVLSNTPRSIEMDTMSGNLELALPEDTGFTVEIDSMSADFTSEFPTTAHKGSHVYGDGRCRISVDAMSGDVTISKNK